MGNYIEQVKTLCIMNLLGMRQRVGMSLVTLVAVAIVVAVFLAFLAMGNGFKQTVNNSGVDDIAIALRGGSSAEINSMLARNELNHLDTAPGIKSDDRGTLISFEISVIVDGIKKGTNNRQNISLRGIGERGFELRENARIVEGRAFEPGKNELLVGQAIANLYKGFEVGQTIRFGKTEWLIAGIFAADGSMHESEIWADNRTVQSQFNRGNVFQIARFALTMPNQVSDVISHMTERTNTELEIKTERVYLSEQSKGVFNLIFYLGWPLSIIMALGALAGALNAMYTSVSQRTQDIATLRALGFGGSSAFIATMFESILISLVGGLVGSLAAYLFFDGMTASTMGASFTQVMFSFELSSESLVTAMLIALCVGLIGGFFPALKAAHIPVVKAFSLQR